jgi:hypothetical protein
MLNIQLHLSGGLLPGSLEFGVPKTVGTIRDDDKWKRYVVARCLYRLQPEYIYVYILYVYFCKREKEPTTVVHSRWFMLVQQRRPLERQLRR